MSHKSHNNDNNTWKNAFLMFKCTAFCFINMAFHEQTLRMAPNSSNFISLLQHLFITSIGLMTIGFSDRKMPIKYYLPLVFLNFFTIYTNNIALNYGVSIPLMMIFKSSSLVANMLLGMLILKHRYSLYKFISVLAITCGLIICTFEDYRLKHPMNFSNLFSINSTQKSNVKTSESTINMTIGIILLTASFLSSALIGIYQEFIARKFGKNSEQTLFYVHLLAIPIFFLTSKSDLHKHLNLLIEDIYRTNQIFNNLTFYLLMVILSQYLCIRTIYRLSTECSSLSMTLCLTNRKFLSLLFSIFYFGNPFTIWHWNGAFIVFGGTIVFYLIDIIAPNTVQQQLKSKSKSQ